jgi:hypothetical protein
MTRLRPRRFARIELASAIAMAIATAMMSLLALPTPAGSDDLASLLSQMNQRSTGRRSVKAGLKWVNFNYVNEAIQDQDTETGEIYFRRRGSDIEVAIHVAKPYVKQILYRHGKLSLYEPKLKRLTEGPVSRSQADVSAFMSLGFGGRGDDLRKSFEVKLIGWEEVADTRTARLELIPKDAELKSKLSKVDIWIDPLRSVPVKLQWFFGEPVDRQGKPQPHSYKLVYYTEIEIDRDVSDSNFRLRTNQDTTVVPLQ